LAIVGVPITSTWKQASRYDENVVQSLSKWWNRKSVRIQSVRIQM